MKWAFGLPQNRYSVQVGMGEGVLSYLGCQTCSDEVVVLLLGMELVGLSDLGGPAYQTKMCVYGWDRRVRQAELPRFNLQ